MQIIFTRFAFLLFLMGNLSFAQDGQQGPYPLPADAKEAVFIYDEQNGFLPPRQNKAPMVTIRADGTIEMPALYSQREGITGKLSPQELQQFLTFVIEKNRFFEIDEAKLRADMKRADLRRDVVQVSDAPDNIFEIRLADRKHFVSQYTGMAPLYKQVEALQQLFAIQRRVYRLKSETNVGGKKGIAALVKQANAALKDQYPDIKPFTTHEFIGSHVRDDGEISALIAREGLTSDKKSNGQFVRAKIKIPPKAKTASVVLQVQGNP